LFAVFGNSFQSAQSHRLTLGRDARANVSIRASAWDAMTRPNRV